MSRSRKGTITALDRARHPRKPRAQRAHRGCRTASRSRRLFRDCARPAVVVGGTPADEDPARAAIGKLDLDSTVAQVVDFAKRINYAAATDNGRGSAWSVSAGAAPSSTGLPSPPGRRSTPAVAYYGPAPDPSEAVKVQVPLLLHYAGLDDRVDATGKAVGRGAESAPARTSPTTPIRTSTTRSTTTPRPNATTSPPPT